MSTVVRTYQNIPTAVLSKVRDYGVLTKFKLSLLVVFSALFGYGLGSAAGFSWLSLGVLSLGGFFISGSANAINQILEKEFDKLMKRTEDRPIAAGRMSVNEAIIAAGLMGIMGISLLWFFFGSLAALMSSLALFSYAFLYTPLKRVGPIAVFVGAIPGALPVLIGWVAATGSLGIEALVLFLIQFLWQFPHFWAIGWVGYEEYQKAGFRLIPSAGGKDRFTGLQSAIYILVLIPVSMLPFLLGITGWVSMAILVLSGVFFLIPALRLFNRCDRKSALQLMFASFIYLPVIQIALLLDKVVL